MTKSQEQLLDALAEEKALDEANQLSVIRQSDSTTLIKELYDRGVTVTEVFGQYYQHEEQGNANTMTVEDAQRAGYGSLEGEDF